MSAPRARRRVVPAGLVLLAAAAGALAALHSAWWLVAVPPLLVAAYGSFLGLTATEVLDAVDDGGDVGRGVPGLLP